MGALMHTLHADQIRLEEAAESIPGLLVMEFEQPARSAREQRLMADYAEARTLIEALQERNAVLAAEVSRLSYSNTCETHDTITRLQRRVEELSHDLATLTGKNATPQRGCRIVESWIGDATVLCEIEYTPATEAIYDADHPGVGPGHNAEITLIQVLINGHWIDPTDFMSETQIEATEQRIFEEIEE